MLLDDGVPVRGGAPRGRARARRALGARADHGGVEDPRVTWLADLGVHVMTYVAYGPLGPRLALAVSDGSALWSRLGPVHFAYEPDLDIDLNLFPNKDAVFFPEPVPGPGRRPCYAHAAPADVGPGLDPRRRGRRPAGRPGRTAPGIWISYVPVDEVGKDVSRLVHLSGHRLVALPEYPYETRRSAPGRRRAGSRRAGWCSTTV